MHVTSRLGLGIMFTLENFLRDKGESEALLASLSIVPRRLVNNEPSYLNPLDGGEENDWDLLSSGKTRPA